MNREGGERDLFEGIIPKFSWGTEENHDKFQS